MNFKTEKRKVRNSLNFSFTDLQASLKTNELPSVTIPDQAYTVQEVYDRFVSGQTLNIALTTPEDEFGINWKKLDFVDIDKIKQMNDLEIHKARTREAETKQKEVDAARIKEIEFLRKQISDEIRKENNP